MKANNFDKAYVHVYKMISLLFSLFLIYEKRLMKLLLVSLVHKGISWYYGLVMT